jgi:maltooligosyltrehalose trehalohydrolase
MFQSVFAVSDVPRWMPRFGVLPEADGARVRVHASSARSIDLVLEQGARSQAVPLTRVDERTFEAFVPGLGAGTMYRLCLDGGDTLPDPASRFQPNGVHGASEVIDPHTFEWTDRAWPGAEDDLVIYELHVGTFSPAGTFAGARARLPEIVDLGVTAIELMPVAEFPGGRNWGYDGAALFAPSARYGRPDDLRALVDAAHAAGIAVILDVVYNHLGPDGAYVCRFYPRFFNPSRESPWGAAVNLDGEGSDDVRAFLIENALHWVHEYHFDGLRLDATHAVLDDSPRHFVAELASIVRHSAGRRRTLVTAEDHRNLAVMLRRGDEAGWNLDGVWADDFHHHVRRLLAGDAESYFADYSGSSADLAATITRGWFYAGQRSIVSGQPRGTDPAGIPARKFIFCLQNHDQIGNRPFGERLHHQVPLAAYRAASALLLLAPETPLLFMGQEWAASTPFLYFTDHHAALGRDVTAGRRREFRAFRAFRDAAARHRIPDPQARETFEASRLNWVERADEPHASTVRLYRALLSLRRHQLDRRAVERPHARALALDDDTVAVVSATRDAAPLVVVARLRGSGTVSLAPIFDLVTLRKEPAWRVLLTTEDPAFAPDGQPPHADLDHDPPAVEFPRPAAVVLI